MARYIIIGSTGDIGSAVHKALDGNEIITFSKSRPARYDSTHYFLDLSKPFDQGLLKEKLGNIDSVDGLIWCPGESLYSLIQDTALEAVDTQYHLSIRSLVTFIHTLLPLLKRSKNGRIIVITSVWGRNGASFESIYASMKGAQEALVKSLAKELAATDITVNAIAPGVVKGAMTDMLSAEDQASLIDELPQRKFVDTDEIAHAIKYLLDEKADSVTGEIMNINGGWYT
ncbi:SDR family NAD(P)-dependent oxidoreductase [Salinicoccus albus]|uniref:SDR family NAD(P)-dependent oxidoreductase n=1 Tax=Salinicoccus albus TaxID=418756 RepID=UPI0003803CEF|nr:SDR family oxidoreductase [Salinicoccus albus]